MFIPCFSCLFCQFPGYVFSWFSLFTDVKDIRYIMYNSAQILSTELNDCISFFYVCVKSSFKTEWLDITNIYYLSFCQSEQLSWVVMTQGLSSVQLGCCMGHGYLMPWRRLEQPLPGRHQHGWKMDSSAPSCWLAIGNPWGCLKVLTTKNLDSLWLEKPGRGQVRRKPFRTSFLLSPPVTAALVYSLEVKH